MLALARAVVIGLLVVALGLSLTPPLLVAGAENVTAGWPMHRFGPAQDGFNPNEHVLNRENVDRLRLTGSLTLGTPYTADPPVVSDGVLYVTGYGLQQTEYLYAFPLDCMQESVCSPIWFATVGFNSQPHVAVGEGLVVVASTAPSSFPQPGRVWAFRVGCASGGAQCRPSWVADFPGTQAIDSAPTIADGLIFVSVGFLNHPYLYALDADCGSGGSSCKPRWRAPVATDGRGSVAVADGIAYVTDYGGVSAFGVHCAQDGRTCKPLWHGSVGIVSGGAAIADNKVFVAAGGFVYSFDANCRQTECLPIWTGGEGADGISAPAVAGGLVYALTNGGDLFAFPVDCRARCRPKWSATVFDRHIFAGLTPAIGNGVVYVTWAAGAGPQRWLEAFPTDCHTPCSELWRGTAGYYEFLGPAIVGGRLLVAGGPIAGPGKVFQFSLHN